jgi:fucose 4-O-acetylase-like acetyltransferase
MSSKREVWVDYVKVFACILVVLGHFFQSMVKANILPENGLYAWFNTTIYYFHVPLFFICSGYLYQKYSIVDGLSSWKQNTIKKAVVLGIPYFAFSLATWLLKTVFSGSVNNEMGGLLDTLFIHPTAPYWYLYVLFFIFVLIPTVRGEKGVYALLVIALGIRCIKAIWGGCSSISDLSGLKDFRESYLVRTRNTYRCDREREVEETSFWCCFGTPFYRAKCFAV